MPTDFTLEGDGTLRPVLRRNVFAMLDGEVKEIKVEDDSQVKKGQVLVVEDSRELEKEIVSTNGELLTTEADIRATQNQSIDNDADIPQNDRNQQEARLSQLKAQSVQPAKEAGTSQRAKGTT